MSERSAIEWTDSTWNPVTGCSRISVGCHHCYAERFAERWRGVPGHPYQQGFDVRLWVDRLDLPLAWKKPRRVFVNSMSDLFHEKVPLSFAKQVFLTMEKAYWHTFQIVTKRSARMAEIAGSLTWPANVWLGVSVETPKYLWRLDHLREVPAGVRFLSLEPLLGAFESIDLGGVDWVIVGGESGPGARAMEAEWAREVRDKCVEAGVPFFFKQWGGVRRKAAGRVLDGRTWEQIPREHLRDV